MQFENCHAFRSQVVLVAQHDVASILPGLRPVRVCVQLAVPRLQPNAVAASSPRFFLYTIDPEYHVAILFLGGCVRELVH